MTKLRKNIFEFTCPLLRYLAADIVFSSTPRGFHENLYRRALSLNSGAGKPEITLKIKHEVV